MKRGCSFAQCMQNLNGFFPHWRTCKVTAVLWYCINGCNHHMDLWQNSTKSNESSACFTSRGPSSLYDMDSVLLNFWNETTGWSLRYFYACNMMINCTHMQLSLTLVCVGSLVIALLNGRFVNTQHHYKLDIYVRLTSVCPEHETNFICYILITKEQSTINSHFSFCHWLRCRHTSLSTVCILL